MQLTLTNTLTRKKEPFKPQTPGEVSMYVCGITPYDHAHIGHGRVYTVFDTLVRLLKFLDYKVTYIRNVTDIDDKIINKARELDSANLQEGSKQIAEKFTRLFQDMVTKLNCLTPTHEPRVTECIDEIITFTQELIKAKHAYVVDGDVYFDIAHFPPYGRLSGRILSDMLAGARVEVNEKKRNPGDFALWKESEENTFWKSPWGYGRPGWHIECSVMAKKYCGVTLDLHGGGMDLIFPHHENEVAQSESLHGKPFATHWMHNAFVMLDKEKMSKSLGNTVTLQAIFEKKDPMVLRYFYLQHHYKTPIDFSFDELDATQTAYKKLVAHFGSLTQPATRASYATLLSQDKPAQDALAALCDDLNTPKFLGIIFENLSTLHAHPGRASFFATLLNSVLGLTLQPLPEATVALTPEIESLLAQRETARKEKNWTLADKIRNDLTALGYQVNDKKN